MSISILAAMAFQVVLLLTPATVAALAVQRAALSRSRNRVIYALLALIVAMIFWRLLENLVAEAPNSPLLILAALASPVGWGIILWVLGSPLGCRYADPAYWNTLPDAPRRTTEPPVRGWMEAAHVAGHDKAGAKVAAPVFRSRTAARKWRADAVLPFVPGAEHPR